MMFASLSVPTSGAATTTVLAVVEAETLTLPPGGSIVSDGQASGGRSLRLSTNGAATTQGPLSAAANRLTVRAKGRQCSGAPRLTVHLDGAQILSSPVASTSWKDYTAAIDVPAGVHSLAVGFTNDYSWLFCRRDLFVDKVTLFGDVSPPPPPPPPAPQCANGADDDADAKTDFPADPGCSSASDDDERDGTQPPPYDPTKRLFTGDFNNGSLAQWPLCQSVAHNDPCSQYDNGHYSMAAVSGPKREGSHAARFEVRDGDEPFCCGERAQVRRGVAETEGKDLWYSWTFMLDQQYPFHGEFQTILEWHSSQDGSPPVGFFVENNRLALRIHPFPLGPYEGTRNIWQTTINKQQWYDVKMHTYWSQNANVGFIELWVNGQRQSFTDNPTNGNGVPCVGQTRCNVRTIHQGDAGNFVVLGYYRHRNISGTGVVYHDNFNVASAEAGLTTPG